MKVTSSETIYYFGAAEYSSVSGWKKLSVYLGREKLVEYSGGVTYFFHSDPACRYRRAVGNALTDPVSKKQREAIDQWQ